MLVCSPSKSRQRTSKVPPKGWWGNAIFMRPPPFGVLPLLEGGLRSNGKVGKTGVSARAERELVSALPSVAASRRSLVWRQGRRRGMITYFDSSAGLPGGGGSGG